MPDRKGNIIVLSAPSGTGKTTISNIILKSDLRIKRSISVTTRKKRDREVNGIDYFFIDKNKFEQLIKQDQLLEYANIFSNYYGTDRKYVENLLNNGIDIFCCIDWQGFLQLKKSVKDFQLISIFLLPSAFSVLKNRLENRDSDHLDINKIRLHNAKEEIQHCYQYDYVVLNDNLHNAVKTVRSIIKINRYVMNGIVLKEHIDNLLNEDIEMLFQ
ncbi:guanylate kinase [Anaplasmataceae bacterium AB001_6]|nr:guanylate kinase [Anaplasmataceae bacterium AB001_6]